MGVAKVTVVKSNVHDKMVSYLQRPFTLNKFKYSQSELLVRPYEVHAHP